MSMKIYEGYRVPLNKLNATILFIKKRMISTAIDFVSKNMATIKDEVVKQDIDKRKSSFCSNPNDDPVFLDKYYRLARVYAMFILSSRKNHWFMNIDCFVKVFIDSKYAYFYAVGPNTISGSGITKMPRYVEEYSYWNNTDKPEHIGNKEWKLRAKKWNKLLSNNYPYMVYDIISMKDPLKTFFSICEIENKIMGTDNHIGIYQTAEVIIDESNEKTNQPN